MTDVQDPEAEAPYRTSGYDWVVRGVYAALIGANLWIAFDWWRDTDQGRAFIDRVKAKAQECEGCAQRRAMLKKATGRMLWQAHQIVEGEDVETTPDVQP